MKCAISRDELHLLHMRSRFIAHAHFWCFSQIFHWILFFQWYSNDISIYGLITSKINTFYSTWLLHVLYFTATWKTLFYRVYLWFFTSSVSSLFYFYLKKVFLIFLAGVAVSDGVSMYIVDVDSVSDSGNLSFISVEIFH